jgi:hypothetical protein
MEATLKVLIMQEAEQDLDYLRSVLQRHQLTERFNLWKSAI